MANVTTYLTPATRVRTVDVGQFTITKSVDIPNAGAAQNDAIQLFTLPCDMRVTDAIQAVSATLGAACTVQLRVNRSGVFTTLTAASTAAAASVNRMNAAPMFLLAGDIIELLVAGAAVGAAANVTVDLEVNRR